MTVDNPTPLDESEVVQSLSLASQETEIEITKELEVIQTYFGKLPEYLQVELALFIESFDYSKMKYNKFADSFNRMYYKIVLTAFNPTDVNKNFFNLKTSYIDDKEFWKSMKKVIESLDVTPENIGYVEFKQALNVLIPFDGFNVAADIYK